MIGPNGDTRYFLRGQIGYVNGISELDKISSLYGQGKYAKSARSVNVDDINEITGYKADNYNVGTSKVNQTGNEVTYTLKEDGSVHYQGTKYPPSDTTSDRKSFTYWTGTEWKSLAGGENIKIKNTFYGYIPQTLKTTSDSAYNLLFENASNQFYWLSSQCVRLEEGYVYFELRQVFRDRVIGYFLYSSYGWTGHSAYGVRPVVSLKSDIQITGREETENTPWILGE